MIFVEAPVDPNCKIKSMIKEVQIDEAVELVEWIRTTMPDGTFYVSGYNIVPKQVYNG